MKRRIMGVDYSEDLGVGSFCIIDEDATGINIIKVESVNCNTNAEFGSIIESVAKAFNVDTIMQEKTYKFQEHE